MTPSKPLAILFFGILSLVNSLPPPQILDISPSTINAGDYFSLRINGSFNTIATQIFIGDASCELSYYSNNLIICNGTSSSLSCGDYNVTIIQPMEEDFINGSYQESFSKIVVEGVPRPAAKLIKPPYPEYHNFDCYEVDSSKSITCCEGGGYDTCATCYDAWRPTLVFKGILIGFTVTSVALLAVVLVFYVFVEYRHVGEHVLLSWAYALFGFQTFCTWLSTITIWLYYAMAAPFWIHISLSVIAIGFGLATIFTKRRTLAIPYIVASLLLVLYHTIILPIGFYSVFVVSPNGSALDTTNFSYPWFAIFTLQFFAVWLAFTIFVEEAAIYVFYFGVLKREFGKMEKL